MYMCMYVYVYVYVFGIQYLFYFTVLTQAHLPVMDVCILSVASWRASVGISATWDLRLVRYMQQMQSNLCKETTQGTEKM